MTLLITIIRWRKPGLSHSPARLLYISGYFVSFAIVAVLGFLGGVILYGFEERPMIPATGGINISETPQIAMPTLIPTETVASGVGFANDVLPILKSRCTNCHGGQKTEEELNLTSYEKLMTVSENGLVLLPGDADNSILAQALVEREMLKTGPKLRPGQAQLIIDWINQGAPDN